MPQKGKRKKAGRRPATIKIKAIDLFCGAGGLTRGLEDVGIDVVKGVDIDPVCEYPYTKNNNAAFVQKSIDKITAAEFSKDLAGASYTLLAGCAPCQPFSTYSQGLSNESDKRWNLLKHFGRIAKELEPDFVTMENVPPLAEQAVFEKFVADLEGEDFWVFHDVVNCADYGVPQQRQRLVLLASKHGPIEMIAPTVKPGSYKTVRDAIEDLPRIKAGESCADDPLHMASKLSPLNLKRIRASKAGGTWRDWDKDLVAACHKKKTGRTYPSVYGRIVVLMLGGLDAGEPRRRPSGMVAGDLYLARERQHVRDQTQGPGQRWIPLLCGGMAGGLVEDRRKVGEHLYKHGN